MGTPTQLPYPPTPRTTPRRGDASAHRRDRRTAARRARRSGRAPIVKMSRRIPPTPVAAPWYGSTALGWLWLSILNATARPSPIEMTPAFSPGPRRRPRPPVGQRPEQRLRLLLYEQCSLHMTLNIASSRSLGSRAEPVADGDELLVRDAETAMERLRIRRRRPGAVIIAGHRGSDRRRTTAGPRPAGARGRRLDERADDRRPVVGAEDRLGRALRVRHQAGDVAGRVAHARRSRGASRSGSRGRPGRQPGAVGVDVAEEHVRRRARARRASARPRSSSPRRAPRASAAAAAPRRRG